MGETRVDLLHLLEDLRDAYPGSLEETIVSEIVANALDSGATTVAFATDAEARTLTVLLASEASSFINGEVLVVDGGFLATGVLS